MANASTKELAAPLGRIASGVFILTARHGTEETGMLSSWVQQCAQLDSRRGGSARAGLTVTPGGVHDHSGQGSRQASSERFLRIEAKP